MINAQRAQRAQEQALYNQQYRAGPSCQRYGPPAGDPYAYGPGYGGGYGYGYGGQRGFGPGFGGRGGYRGRNNGLGGGGALPLLGALAGGLILGDILF